MEEAVGGPWRGLWAGSDGGGGLGAGKAGRRSKVLFGSPFPFSRHNLNRIPNWKVPREQTEFPVP